ncbi:MAG: hypothetical protein HY796_00530 [Elusimicrobia bacterium]|nr:hypothetical protein [Elusimicrobiota bacterium]
MAWSNETIKGFLEDMETVGNWIMAQELAALTSDVTKFWTPTANMLLKHARDENGKELNDQNYPDEAARLREKIKDTSEYKDALEEVLAKLEKNPDKEQRADRDYELYNPDLYFAIHQFDVTGRLVDGEIQITFHDRYDFDSGFGKWLVDAGLIEPYEVYIVMPAVKKQRL